MLYLILGKLWDWGPKAASKNCWNCVETVHKNYNISDNIESNNLSCYCNWRLWHFQYFNIFFHESLISFQFVSENLLTLVWNIFWDNLNFLHWAQDGLCLYFLPYTGWLIFYPVWNKDILWKFVKSYQYNFIDITISCSIVKMFFRKESRSF